VSGFLVGTLLTLILTWLSFPAAWWQVWIAATRVTTTCVWRLLRGEHRRLMWSVETVLGADLDGDGVKGDPAKRLLEVELHAGRSTVFVGSDFLEMDDDQLLAFAVGVAGGQGLAEGTWAKNRRAFPRGINEYRLFRGRLQDAGLIRPVNPDALNLGYEVSPSGRAVFGRLAEHANTHTHGGGLEYD
jgi:hypothetical protein